MGFEKMGRPLMFAGSAVGAAKSTEAMFSNKHIKLGGSARISFSTGASGGVVEPVETLTSTAAPISPWGVSLVSVAGSTADKTMLLARPAMVGARKTLICRSTGAQKLSVTVAGTTTTGMFEGTTFRTITFSSNSTKQRTATLVALSTNQWAVVAKSTGASLAG